MGTKDMTENYLEAYNDVFADLVNVLLFDGKRVIDPDHLADTAAKAVYKADGSLHEEERDIAKFWTGGHIRIAFFGLENQTDLHPFMPMRVMGYDGAAYREQLLSDAQKEKYPVITLVLYFGTEHPWNKPEKLSDCFRVPDELKPFFSDYRINVFNIAFLPDETVRKFTSDFRIVADYFTQVRKSRDYIPSREKMEHVNAVLKLMTVMTGDDRFLEAQDLMEGEVHTMCEVMERVEQKGIEKGVKQGMEQGMVSGELKKGVQIYHNLIERGFSREDALAIAEIPENAVDGEE